MEVAWVLCGCQSVFSSCRGVNLTKRMKEREREREADERDGRKEFEEMEAAKRRLLEDPTRDPNATELLITQMEANISGHLRKRLRMVDLENLPTVESVVQADSEAPADTAPAAASSEGAAAATAGGGDQAEGSSPEKEGREHRKESASEGGASPSRSVNSPQEAAPRSPKGKNGPLAPSADPEKAKVSFPFRNALFLLLLTTCERRLLSSYFSL